MESPGHIQSPKSAGALAKPVATDEAAFRAWYDASLPRVYSYLFTRCGRNTDLAEELTQETFVEAVRSLPRGIAEQPVTWLIGIARHRLLDHFRAMERRERRFLRLVATSRPQSLWMDDADPLGRVAEALARLPAPQRAAVVLCYVDGLPVREAAVLLQRTDSSVESLLGRARTALRVSLSEEPR
jgi:RNA polymerase sigma-70 factor (ECF subfamily)